MDAKRIGRTGCLAVLLGFGWAALPALAKESFTLVSAVPDDVFFCVATRHNPERDFLAKYWGEVFDELKKSGVCADALAMISGIQTEEQQAEVQRLKDKVTQLIEGVDWTALGGGEFVFAERWSSGMRIGGNVAMGPPDMAFLIRGTTGSAAKNYDGLVAILQSIAGEINGAAGKEVLLVEASTAANSKTASTNLLRTVENASELPIAVSLHGDVIVITVGKQMLTDVMALLDGDKSIKPIAADPRFRTAFAELPAAEDEMTFFDMSAVFKLHRAMLRKLADEATAEPGDVMRNAHLSKEADAIAGRGHDAYREKNYEQALELTKKAHELAPKDSRHMYNLACFHAMVGHEDEAMSWLEKAVDAGFYSPTLIAQDEDLKALRVRPEFQVALTKAAKYAHRDADEKVKPWVRLVERLIDVPEVVDYIATVSYTDGLAVHTEESVALRPGAATAPIYPAFGKRGAIDKFDRYLPVETSSFSLGAGLDWPELYTFIQDTLQEVEIDGQNAWAKWESVQKTAGVDVRNDVLRLIRGDHGSVTMRDEGGEASVWMVGVTDEAAASQKLTELLEALTKNFPELVKKNPMLAMWTMRTSPTEREALPGFHNIQVGMMPEPAVAGVIDGHLFVGSSAEAVEYCLATAQGKHPSVRENKTLMAGLIVPKGPFHSLSYTDRRRLGEEIAQGIGIVGMVGGFAGMAIPDPGVQKILTKALQIVGKLGPVAKKLDFYKSEASVAMFDGKGWRKRSVTNYRSPEERVAATQK